MTGIGGKKKCTFRRLARRRHDSLRRTELGKIHRLLSFQQKCGEFQLPCGDSHQLESYEINSKSKTEGHNIVVVGVPDSVEQLIY